MSSSARVALLGPLHVTVAGMDVSIPGAGERALLSLLALHVGRSVSVDRLVDALWQADLPANPANALQTKVSKLRRVVGDIVATRNRAYALEVDPAQVDARSFRDLIARRRYRDALTLWRGAPLREFRGQAWADTAAAGLEEERLRALTGRIHADLVSGRHRELVAELEDLVGEYPTRERLWEQLMLALYRSDRQADALHAYRRAHTVLADELGLEPGVRLRELEQAILRQDVRLAGSRPSRRPSLPTPLTSLVGREAERDEIVDLLDKHRLVTLTGPGGAGKTRLAIEAAARVADAFADGVHFVRLAETTDVAGVSTALADALGIDAPTVEDGWVSFASYLSRRQTLVVLDNCEQVATIVAHLVRRLLEATPELRILVTSRTAPRIAGGAQLRVPPLPPDDASALFLARARDLAGGSLRESEPSEAVAAICQRLDGLPLAIELAAAWTRTLPVEVIASRLTDNYSLLEDGDQAEDRHRTMRATVAWSHGLLGDPERRVFRRLAVFQGGWALEDAETVCAGDGVDARSVLPLLHRLVEHSLVVADGDRFRLLETIRVFALEELQQTGEEGALRAAHARHFRERAAGAAESLRGPEQSRWLAWLHTNSANIAASLRWQRKHAAADQDALLEATAGLAWFWFLGRHGDGRRALSAALQTAQHASPAARGRALQAQSIVERPGGCVVHPDEFADALADESFRLLADVDVRRAVLSEVMRCVAAVGGRDLGPVLSRLDRARERLRAWNDRWGMALADFVAMEALIHQATIEQAVRRGQRARTAFERLGDVWGTSSVAEHLGHGLRLAGRISEAEALLQVSLDEAERAGFTNTACGAVYELALTAVEQDDRSIARERLGRTRVLADDLGNRMLRGLADVTEASLLLEEGAPTTARDLAWSALGLLRGEGDLPGVAEALALVACCDEYRGDLVSAGPHAREALETALSIRNRGLEARALEVLALVASREGEPAHAAALLGRAARMRGAGQRPAPRLEQHLRGQVEDRTRAVLGVEAYEAAFDAEEVEDLSA